MGLDTVYGPARTRYPDADLTHAADVRHLRYAPHDVPMSFAHAMPLVDEVQMSIELHDAERPPRRHCPDNGNRNRVIATENHRERTAGHQPSDCILNVGKADVRAHVHHVD